MFRSMWIHKLLGLSRSRSTRRRQAAQNRRFVRLGLEGLEDRVTPTTTVAAPDVGTLVTDIAKFNVDGYKDDLVIQLTGSSPYNLPSGQTISNANHTLTIQGTDSSTSIINAGPNDRAFDVQNGVKVTFEKLTLQGGNLVETSLLGGGGGAIRDVGGDVTLSGVVVKDNTVTAGINTGAQGGGIYVSHTGSLTIKANSTIQGNNAIGTTPQGFKFADASGGGVFVTGGSTLSIDSSTISGNLARGGSGQDASGGGVYAYGSTVSITNSSITGNIAQGGNGNKFDSTGGDAIGGGLALKDDSSPSLSGLIISGNSAFGGTGAPGKDGGDASGGGVYLTLGESNVDLSDTSFTQNIAQGGNGGNANSGQGGDGGQAQGGGLFMSLSDGTRTANLTGVALTDNTAQGGSGGKGADAVFSSGPGSTGGNGGDGASATGGGAYLKGYGTVNMIGASVSDNTAQGGNGGQGGTGGAGTTGGHGGNGGDGDGGYAGGLYLKDYVTLNITNSALVGNKATGGSGATGGDGGAGGITGGDAGKGGDGDIGAGGGIYYKDGTLTVLNTTIANNLTQGGNGGVGGKGGTGGTNSTGDDGPNGNGHYAAGGGVYDAGNGKNGTFFNDTIAFNQALGGSGGQVETSQGFTSLGGGYFDANHSWYLSKDGPTVKNTLFQGNLAAQGPDFSGAIGQLGNVASESNNFFSSIDGTLFPNRPPSGKGTPNTSDIVSTVSQLGSMKTDPATGLAYFPLLPQSDAIGTGTITTLPAITAAEGLSDPSKATDEIGAPRVVNNMMDIGATAFGGESTTTAVTPVAIPQNSFPTEVNLTATVGGSSVNEGVVSFTVTDSGGNPVGGTVANVHVMNGVATTTFTVPGNQSPGDYKITANYTDDGGHFGSSTGIGTLTISATGKGTSVTPGNASVTESSSDQTTGVAVLVTSPGGTVTKGTVTVTLMQNGNPVGSPVSAQVNSTGAAMVTGLKIPAGFQPGTYNLKEAYHDSTGEFGDSQGFGTLTVNPSSTSVTVTNPVLPVTTTGNVPVTVTNTVTTTTNNQLPPALALFFDIVAFILDQNGLSSISAAFNLPTTTADAFAFAAANFNATGGSLGATVIPMAVQTGTQIVSSMQGK